ncbi:MAG: DUF2158 domain-containing protein [Pseudomonadota bacterium]|jgi:uncharacterized protein YodC (DUF2158 family)
MTRLKEGDLVVLKSGGPVMTVDAVNTSVFDDAKVTGVSCVWFVGDSFHRVRFDPKAVERAKAAHIAAHAAARHTTAGRNAAAPQYTSALDTVIGAMNDITETAKPVASSSANGATPRATTKRPSPRTTAKAVTPKIVTS